MRATVHVKDETFEVDFSKPIDISIPLQANQDNPVAWYIDAPKIEPEIFGEWTALVSEGASVNFRNIYFNPHGHGTHTECLGHITAHIYSLNDCLKTFMFKARLITVVPETFGKDKVLTKKQVAKALGNNIPEAVILRTLPNTTDKKKRKWSDTNWPYLLEEAGVFLRESGVKHLLLDLPSVDRERDDGKLLCHHAFWNVPKNKRLDATITEMIYVPHQIKDGDYLLNIQIASFENDASPSKPVIYELDPA